MTNGAATEAVSTAIRLDNVRKEYIIDAERVEALRGVSLSIPEGAMVSVTGKSGAGKSTLLHIIGTLDRPSSGDLFLGDTNVSRMDDGQLSRFRNRAVGFVFQMNNLLPEFSAIENVMMPGIIGGHQRAALETRAKDLLSMVGLAQRFSHRPGEMSGGEQQRVAIARALVMSPPILVADEPTGNLDKKTSLIIQDLLLDVVKQHRMTMLLVTHDLDLASRLPQQVVMEDGLIVSGGDIH